MLFLFAFGASGNLRGCSIIGFFFVSFGASRDSRIFHCSPGVCIYRFLTFCSDICKQAGRDAVSIFCTRPETSEDSDTTLKTMFSAPRAPRARAMMKSIGTCYRFLVSFASLHSFQLPGLRNLRNLKKKLAIAWPRRRRRPRRELSQPSSKNDRGLAVFVVVTFFIDVVVVCVGILRKPPRRFAALHCISVIFHSSRDHRSFRVRLFPEACFPREGGNKHRQSYICRPRALPARACMKSITVAIALRCASPRTTLRRGATLA